MHFTYNHDIFIPKQHIYQPKAKESQTQTHLRTLTCESLSYIKQSSHPSMETRNKHVHVHHKRCMFMSKHDLPLLILQHLSTYGIMNEHVNACSCHQSKKQT